MLHNTRGASLLLAVCAFALAACASPASQRISHESTETAAPAPELTPSPSPTVTPQWTETPIVLPTFTPGPTATPEQAVIPETGPFEPMDIPVTVDIPKDTYRLLGLSETDVVSVDSDRMRQVFLYISMMRENNWSWADVKRMTPAQEQQLFDAYLQMLRTSGDSTFIMPDWKALKTLEGGDTLAEVFKEENTVDIRDGFRFTFKSIPLGMVGAFDDQQMNFVSPDPDDNGLFLQSYFIGPKLYPNGLVYGRDKSFNLTYGLVRVAVAAPSRTTREFRTYQGEFVGDGTYWHKANSQELRDESPPLLRGFLGVITEMNRSFPSLNLKKYSLIHSLLVRCPPLC